MPLIFQHRIHALDLLYNPTVMYAFGDNDQRVGKGGQAKECRGHPNAVGIRTKKGPGVWTADYYTDDEFEENCRKLDEDFELLFEHLRRGNTVVWPIDGVGTGRAELDARAPRTMRYIQDKLDHLKALDHMDRTINSAQP